ncbi:MAG TPA: amidohydrolase family protein [Pyrinomonadaceae bacterium]|nr:amidohydrolase family protein [Pyrinomonadaceae bacterium]
MKRNSLFLVLMIAALSAIAARGQDKFPVPLVDHHQHLFSPPKAKLVYEQPLAPVELPQDLAGLVREREKAWNDPSALARLFAEDGVLLNTQDEDQTSWMKGRDAVAKELSIYFENSYRITPVAFKVEGTTAYVAGYYTKGEGEDERHFGHVLFTLSKGRDQRWLITVEAPTFPGPPRREPGTADQLIAQLDDAGIQRAVVLSVAYQWGTRYACPNCTEEEEYAKVRAENDYVAQQVARYPERLVGFCSFNPLKGYALKELDRCRSVLHLAGLKLHLGNSRVDVRKPEHAEKLRQVFRAANERKVPVVIHLWTNPAYETEGGEHAKVFLAQILPEAPDITVQIAHMAGGGRATPAAMEVFADAIAANDPRTKNLYFDVATLTAGETAEGLKRDAAFIRKVGVRRILYGTDTAPPNPPARVSWGLFRGLVPLTDDEFRIIASNVAPYLR